MGFDAFVKLMRAPDCAMSFFAVLLGYWITTQGFAFPFPEFLFAVSLAFAAFFVCAGGQAINDYYDAEIDAKEKPYRPIPKGEVTKAQAKNFAIALFALGAVFSLSLFAHSTTSGAVALVLAVLSSFLLAGYSKYLKEKKYVGNAVVSLSIALAFVFGGVVRLEELGAAALGGPLFLSVAPFFANMAREVTKDIEDLKKDQGAKVTFPMKFGLDAAKKMVVVYTFASILFGIFYGQIFFNVLYVPFLLIGSFFFMSAALLNFNNFYTEAARYQKVAMVIILFGYLLGLLPI